MKRFSKLKKTIESLMIDGVEIFCLSYPMDSQRGSHSFGRYYVKVDKKIVWDYPKDFPEERTFDKIYVNEIAIISQIIRDYIDTPRDRVKKMTFENDRHKITDVLKKYDRRFQ